MATTYGRGYWNVNLQVDQGREEGQIPVLVGSPDPTRIIAACILVSCQVGDLVATTYGRGYWNVNLKVDQVREAE